MAKTADYGLGKFDFPRGWFMIAESSELQDKPQGVRFFGKDFALYRGKSGRVVMLDAYCPHMKTHLAKNTTSYVVIDNGGTNIEGDSIRCPYHGWRINAEGKVDDIPYSPEPPPPSACVKSYRLAEAMGAVWFWHDAEGGEPEWELDVLPQWNDPAWVRWSLASLGMLDQHPMELLDNIADYPHLDPIHGAHTNRFENEFQEHKVIQRQAGPHRDMLGEPGTPPVDLINITTYHGPGLLISDMRMPNADTVIAITHTPVDDGRVKVWHGLMVKGMSGSTQHTAEDAAEAHALEAQNRLGFAQDFEVWQHKAPCFQGMYVAGDGPFRKVRQWYRQFYNPRRQKDEFTPPAGQRYLAKGVAPFTPVAEFPETV